MGQNLQTGHHPEGGPKRNEKSTEDHSSKMHTPRKVTFNPDSSRISKGCLRDSLTCKKAFGIQWTFNKCCGPTTSPAQEPRVTDFISPCSGFSAAWLQKRPPRLPQTPLAWTLFPAHVSSTSKETPAPPLYPPPLPQRLPGEATVHQPHRPVAFSSRDTSLFQNLGWTL